MASFNRCEFNSGAVAAAQLTAIAIYAGHDLVEHAGRWHVFYSGVSNTHNYRRSDGLPPCLAPA